MNWSLQSTLPGTLQQTHSQNLHLLQTRPSCPQSRKVFIALSLKPPGSDQPVCCSMQSACLSIHCSSEGQLQLGETCRVLSWNFRGFPKEVSYLLARNPILMGFSVRFTVSESTSCLLTCLRVQLINHVKYFALICDFLSVVKDYSKILSSRYFPLMYHDIAISSMIE